jgi:hypothetical protein
MSLASRFEFWPIHAIYYLLGVADEPSHEGRDMSAGHSTLSLRPALWVGLGITIIGLLIVVYAGVVYLENRSAPPPPGVSAPLLPIGILGLGLAILVIGLVTAVIGKRAKDVWPR